MSDYKFYTVSLIISILFTAISVTEQFFLLCIFCQLCLVRDEDIVRQARSHPDNQQDPEVTKADIKKIRKLVALSVLLQLVDLTFCVTLLAGIIKHMSLLVLIYIVYGIVLLVGRTVFLFLSTLSARSLEVALCTICWWMINIVFNSILIIVLIFHYMEIK